MVSTILATVPLSVGTNFVYAADNDIAHVADEATTSVSSKAVTFSVPASAEQQFINLIAPVAQQAASHYGLYPSVMMAQAILESGWGTSQASQAPNYNFFGIKGNYNGASFNMPTKEWSKDRGFYTVDCYFKKYPNMLESFNDNGNKLRNGVSWNKSYYSGTWQENTNSYRDATAWLQGRYATDPSYASKLNRLIETYHLNQYDTNNTDVETTNASDQVINGIVKIKNTNNKIYGYSPLGSRIVDLSFEPQTTWKFDHIRSINGVKYYKVGTDVLVRAVDVEVVN